MPTYSIIAAALSIQVSQMPCVEGHDCSDCSLTCAASQLTSGLYLAVTLHLAPCTLHRAPCTLHLASFPPLNACLPSDLHRQRGRWTCRAGRCSNCITFCRARAASWLGRRSPSSRSCAACRSRCAPAAVSCSYPVIVFAGNPPNALPCSTTNNIVLQCITHTAR